MDLLKKRLLNEICALWNSSQYFRAKERLEMSRTILAPQTVEYLERRFSGKREQVKIKAIDFPCMLVVAQQMMGGTLLTKDDKEVILIYDEKQSTRKGNPEQNSRLFA